LSLFREAIVALTIDLRPVICLPLISTASWHLLHSSDIQLPFKEVEIKGKVGIGASVLMNLDYRDMRQWMIIIMKLDLWHVD